MSLLLNFIFPQAKLKNFLETLILISERISFENGCISCGIFKDRYDENRYKLIGKWKQEEGLYNYMLSDEFNVLLGGLSFLQKQPRMRLNVVSSIKEIETKNIPCAREMRYNVQQ